MSSKPPIFRQSPDTNVWRDKDERSRLVERVIEQDREIRQLRTILNEYAEQYDEDRSVGSYIRALQARINVLEQNVERLVRERGAA